MIIGKQYNLLVWLHQYIITIVYNNFALNDK